MKTKTCKRTECKFFHITGTKKEDNNTQGNPNDNAGNNGNNITNFPNNPSAPQQSQTPVFQEARQPWEIAIDKMAAQMERIMNLQQSFQTQIQPLLQPQRNQNQNQPALTPNW